MKATTIPSSDRIPLPANSSSYRKVTFATTTGPADPVHLLGVPEIHAINAAIAAGRPLLVRGEPGIGKSQLARAAARELGRAYIKCVVDSRTESRDLMWTFDAVRRLGDAQLAGALRENANKVRSELAIKKYVCPGPLWWAFDAEGAARQAKLIPGAQAPLQPDAGAWSRGCVLLLDEIDKAEAEVPNGLLEALGAREFTPFGLPGPVRLTGKPPLVVITTNEERVLPDAFLRRCFVLPLALPKEEGTLQNYLIERGEAHFPNASKAVLQQAASMLWEERRQAIEEQVTAKPGQAEYLDLLRAVTTLSPDDDTAQLAMLENVGRYTMRKHVVGEGDRL
jgi:MoxR-like ATPase